MEAELKEGQEDALGLYMNLDARPDSSSFEDWKYSSSQQIRYETSHVCSFITHIVGLRSHPAMVFSDHELVTLVRYPQCPRDKYAIKVFNSTSMEVGYLHDEASAALSPLIDAQMINLEGEVTHSRTGDVEYSVPCLVRVFSKSTDLENVTQSIFGTALCLTGEPRTNPETNEGKRDKEKGRIEKLGTLEPPKEVIKAKLFDHQKEGLWWLVNKENSDELPPFWEMKDGLYVNVLTRHQTNTKPETLHGGIFADDYGTGKTLTLLSLIAFDKVGNVPEGTGEEDEGVSVCSGKKRGRVSEMGAGEPKTHTLLDSNIKESYGGMADKSSSASVSKQTLIVCPSSVCSTWKNQLLEHTEKGSLKLHKYYGNSKIKDVEELKKYDIVLTTYGAFANESFQRCPLLKIEWWRVILDEADVIKNANAKKSLAVSRLTARRRWAVTGAPIQNGSFDLFALIAFLRLDPLSNKSYWQSLLERPLAKKDGNGFSRLQDLMAAISLRRTKDRVLVGQLRSKTVETVRFKIYGDERERYDQMEAESKKVVRELIATGRLNRSYASIRGAVIRLRQMCNDTTPFSSYLKSLLPSDDIGDASEYPELLRKLIDVLREDEDFDCAICYCPPTDAVITICKHVFCKRCIGTCLQRTRSSCPICRGRLSMSDLFSAPPESSDPKDPRKSTAIIPTKVSTLIKLLKESGEGRPNSKSVVFTIFQKMLVLLEAPLKDAGFNVLRLDALTDARRRVGIIKKFQSAGQNTVLIANVKVSGAGINLTAASEIYLLEPWWNSELEEQAIDRVHQYGQEKNVIIVRLIVKDSIEERILMMQERKKQAIEAFGMQGPKERREVSLEDLCSLLSLE